MSTQIITNFKATGTIYAVQDEKHIEIFVEGRAGDNMKAVAKLAAQVIYDTAKQAVEAGIKEAIGDIDSEQLSDTEKATITLSHKLREQITKELGAIALKDKMKEQGIPAEIIDDLAEAMSNIGFDIVSRAIDEEEGDDE